MSKSPIHLKERFVTLFRQTAYQALLVLGLAVAYKTATLWGVDKMLVILVMIFMQLLSEFWFQLIMIMTLRNDMNWRRDAKRMDDYFTACLHITATGFALAAVTFPFMDANVWSTMLAVGLAVGGFVFMVKKLNEVHREKRHLYWRVWPGISVAVATMLELSGSGAFAVATIVVSVMVSLQIARTIDEEIAETQWEGI